MSKRDFIAALPLCATLSAGLFQLTVAPAAAAQSKASNTPAPVCEPAVLGSPYIPVDSWVYPAVLRLYSLGFVDDVFLGMRPWTRASVGHMVEQAGGHIQDASGSSAADEAQVIYDALTRELRDDSQGPCGAGKGSSRVESVYSVVRGISGTSLRDSYHLGSTIINDYGRPYENGFNNYAASRRRRPRPQATPRRWPRLSASWTVRPIPIPPPTKYHIFFPRPPFPWVRSAR
jgi:hypothetical protein